MMGKQWLEELDKDVLYFTPFYDEEVRLAELYNEDGDWYCKSELFNIDEDYIGSDKFLGNNSKELARQYVEDLVQTHLESEVSYHQSLLDCFKS